jgi:TRAP-type transport system periplasmic protein
MQDKEWDRIMRVRKGFESGDRKIYQLIRQKGGDSMDKLLDKRIKRRSFIKGAAVGALAVATGFPNILRAAEKYRFKFATFEPAHSIYTTGLWHFWCDRVEALSKGTVKFDKFPGETLVKAPECYEAVRDGISQCGIFTIPYEAGLVTLPTIKELPFTFVNQEIHHKMWNEMLEAGLQDFFHSYGIHMVADHTTGPFNFWTSKKWGPIKRLEDLKGCKVRSPGGGITKALEAMGSSPIAMPSPESYTAIERGTLDAISMPEEASYAWRHHEVVAYISRPRYGQTGLPICVNLKIWNSLPKEIQGIMLQAGEDAYSNFGNALKKYYEEVVDPAIQKHGIQIVEISDSEKARMKKACGVVWDDWLAKNGNTFNGLGKKMFDILLKHVDKP